MNRRELIQLGAAVFVLPSLVRAQAVRKPARVAVLSSATPEARSKFWEAFKGGMEKLGWREGQDVVYVYRYARGDASKFDVLAAELAAEKPDLVFAGTLLAAQAAQRATREIPIVFGTVGDPIGGGLVASLARPGGRVTGLTGFSPAMRTKIFELLREIRPKMRRIAVLVSSGPAGEEVFGDIERAASASRIQADRVVVPSDAELDKILQSLAGKRLDGVIFLTGIAGLSARKLVAERLAQMKLPAIFPLVEMVDAGGLVSYGASLEDNYRRAATYVDAILKGAKPADLPVQQPTNFELAVNLKTARALGLTIPETLLFRATKVIE